MSRPTGRRAGTASRAVRRCSALSAAIVRRGRRTRRGRHHQPVQGAQARRRSRQAFGGTVASGKKGLSTPVSAQCEFQVGANADRPDGTVIVHLMTTGAKAAYTGLKKIVADVRRRSTACPTRSTREKLQVVNVLKGDVLRRRAGRVHRSPTRCRSTSYDDKTQLTELAQLAGQAGLIRRG